MKQKVVLSLSGGLDSSTLLAYLLDVGYEVIPVSFMYGSKHGEYEEKAAVLMAGHYNIDPACHYVLHVRDVFHFFKSNLLQSGGPIPEGHYQAETMKQTVVPGRNLIFASILAGLAESIGASVVALGVHAGDHAIYPDCRPRFVEALRKTVEASSDGKVSICTPFLLKSKADIVREGLRLGVPYHLTRTCYKQQEVACGRCGSCRERLEAFQLNGVDDPIKYEEVK